MSPLPSPFLWPRLPRRYTIGAGFAVAGAAGAIIGTLTGEAPPVYGVVVTLLNARMFVDMLSRRRRAEPST